MEIFCLRESPCYAAGAGEGAIDRDRLVPAGSSLRLALTR